MSMPPALTQVIQRYESQGNHERAQHLRDGFMAQQAAKQSSPPSAPAVPLVASPPLTRAETIRRLCQLYGHADRAEYFVKGGGTPAQVAGALGLLGAPGKP